LRTPTLGLLALQILFLAVLASSLRADEAASPSTPQPGKKEPRESLLAEIRDEWDKHFKDPDDDSFDVSHFLSKRYGFLPVPITLTEPTLGYGGGTALLFTQPRLDAGKEGYLRPNVTAVGGLATENGTWVAFAGDSRFWMKGRVKTLAAVLVGRIRLEFYGIGDDRIFDGEPLEYQLNTAGTRVGAQRKIGDTHWWLGLNYQYLHVNASFGEDVTLPRFLEYELGAKESVLSGPSFRVTYDSRNSSLSPSKGLLSETRLSTGWEALGGTTDYQKLSQTSIGYFPLSKTVFLGLRGDVQHSFGATPFYILPAISMRGVPALRYQGTSMAQGQAQINWRFWRRLSVLSFMGGGGTWDKNAALRNAETTYAGGVGLRYDIAKKFQLQYGVDFAYGPDGGTFYIVLGSAWTVP